MVVSRRGASAKAPRTKFEAACDHRIIVGDCVAEMAKLEAGSVDLVFADPPFNIGYDFQKGSLPQVAAIKAAVTPDRPLGIGLRLSGEAAVAAGNIAIPLINALIAGGATLAAAFNAALANFPSPAAFVAALNGALAAINPTLGVLANALTTFTGQLNATLQAGIAAGLTGFQALLNALGNPASALFAAFQAALAAFPNPAAFFNALGVERNPQATPVQLSQALGILDNERATKISGAMFTMQRGNGAALAGRRSSACASAIVSADEGMAARPRRVATSPSCATPPRDRCASCGRSHTR